MLLFEIDNGKVLEILDLFYNALLFDLNVQLIEQKVILEFKNDFLLNFEE